MNAQQFLAEFGHIAKAPRGMTRLRELIFSLASDGKLLDESELVEPVHLDQVADFVMGQAPPGNECNTTGEGTVFVKTGEFGELYPLVREWTTKPLKIAKRGDVLICVVGATVGKLNLSIDCAIGRSVAAVRPRHGLNTKYLFFMLMPFTLRLRSGSRGSAQGVIGKAELSAIKIRVPSDDEQDRIVAKVDELMALCDRLEKQHQDRRKLQNALRRSTLQALASAESPHELQESWQRLQAHFGRLFSEPEDLRDFKALVLDLAVSGRLLPVPRASNPASALIENIAHARVAWAGEAEEQEKKEAVAMLKKLRTQQITVPSAPLPPHWCWASLLQVSQAVVDCHNKTAPYVDEGIHLVRTTDIRDGRMDLTKTRKISEETYAYWARRMPPKAGDIFFTREAPMGEAAIVPEGERVCLGQRTMLIRLFPELFSSRYLLYVIQSPSFQARMIEAAIGMTVKHLRVGGVEDLMIPVPPREEQNRVVDIVDRLFELCGHHADRIGNSLRVAANLATTTVAALTGVSVDVEEESPLKAPQTELIAPLRLGTLPDVKDLAPLATLLARNQREMSARDLWQRFGGEIDAFYAQLKTEVAHGWITEPPVAEVRAKPVESAEA